MSNALRLMQEADQLLGLSLAQKQLDLFTRYQEELISWNEKFNLTAIQEPEDIRVKHFLDSLSCSLAMQGTPMNRVVDVGTGAGFPSFPLKFLYPEIHLTLVESVAKKTAFLTHLVNELKLEGVEVLTGRAEVVGQMADHRERYDWAVARSVARLPVLVEYLLPLVKVGGFALAQKGDTARLEVEDAQTAIEILGGKFDKVIPVELPGIDETRYLVVIKKIAPTPEKYPRREGMPAKRPLE